MNRRDFLRLAGVGLFGGILLLLFGRWHKNGRLTFKDWDTCSRLGICKDCFSVPECCLPQALSFRKRRRP